MQPDHQMAPVRMESHQPLMKTKEGSCLTQQSGKSTETWNDHQGGPTRDAAHPCPSLGQVFTFCIARNQGLRASVVSTAPNDQSPETGPQKPGELCVLGVASGANPTKYVVFNAPGLIPVLGIKVSGTRLPRFKSYTYAH